MRDGCFVERARIDHHASKRALEAVPVLAFRRSREPWWGAMPLDELARTIRARVCAPALP